MNDNIVFDAWGIQKQILKDNHRVIGAFAGKRSGKTECGAIKAIMLQEQKVNYNKKSIDPFVGAIIAPTFQMLTRLSLKKFMLYAKPFIRNFNKSTYEIEWHDGSIIYGLSADRPERIEGLKLHWGWLDEVFQMSEQLFLELKARTSDTQGNIIATGSLGVQFINPKQHWAYKYFKEKPDQNTSCYEWSTKDNPHFPKDELESLRNQLDPVTFRAMFEIDWDTIPKNAVYHLFSNDNVIESYSYNPSWPTYISIDWGFAHDMAVGFFQVNPVNGTVFMFDEIVQNKLTLDQLWERLKPRIQNYNIHAWFCDVAGNQERELTGQSNIKWFKERGIYLKHTRDSIANGISLVRSYVCNTAGYRRFYIANNCKKTIDGLKQYRYPEKDGHIVNENPIKKDDDAVDMVRYFFMNYELSTRPQPNSQVFKVR